MMSVNTQSNVVFLIAAFICGMVLRRLFRQAFAPRMAQYFLKRGRVRWAMWFKSKSARNSCC
jgi:hypothetical protein